MSTYQVLARKWRPQRFDDVIGQRGVTQTLRNAIAAGRIAQSFVFAGPRGVGKTTTARILARCLNCEKGPTAEPCGGCDACREIAQGRDMDVLEIDAATNTQVDKVREVIIAGLGMAPVRDRYKIFIIDEVHRLSAQAFDALLKSIEEPPPHVVFMMATTEIEKVPPTIQSRSQVFELKTIGVKPIADQLRKIADAEGIQVDDASLMLVARAGEGSMRDAQSAFDQVIAFAGTTIDAEAVATVLGLVRRDLLLNIADAIAAEDGAAAFDLAGRAVESGYDLRLVIRELGRLTRDILVIGIDKSRANDPEIAAESERDRLLALADKFSAEDLMRAFDVLTKAEADIKASLQPRYHLEMALLRWIHLRHLVPITELIQTMDKGGPMPSARAAAATPPRPASAPPTRPGPPVLRQQSSLVRAVEARREGVKVKTVSVVPADSPAEPLSHTPVVASDFKAAFLDELERTNKVFRRSVLAQTEQIELIGDRLRLTFHEAQKNPEALIAPQRVLLEELASRLSGRKVTIEIAQNAGLDAQGDNSRATPPSDRQAELKAQALTDSAVQAMLDVFGTDIKEVEER